MIWSISKNSIQEGDHGLENRRQILGQSVQVDRFLEFFSQSIDTGTTVGAFFGSREESLLECHPCYRDVLIREMSVLERCLY